MQRTNKVWSAVCGMFQWLSEDVVLLQGGSKPPEARARLAELGTEACRPADGAAGGGSGLGWGSGPAAAELTMSKGRPRRCKIRLPSAMSCQHVNVAAWNDLLQPKRLHRV